MAVRRDGPKRRAVLLTLLAASCTSAEPTYYTLAPAAPANAVPLPSRAPRTVELRRFGLAGYLDRPEIVRAGGDYQLRVAGGEQQALAVCERAEVFTLGESLGGVESLIEHPGRMTHASVVGTDLEVPADLIRLSVGIESIEDLVADLDRSLG